MARKTVFLTGAAGRLGNRVLRLLVDKGYSVRALVHRRKPEGIANDKVELVSGSIQEPASLDQAADGCEIVCHLACQHDMFGPPKFEKDNIGMFDNAVTGTFNVLEAARKAGCVRQFLFASSDAVFAAIYKKYDSPITEEVEVFPRPGRLYAVAKALGEDMCKYYQLSFDVPYTIIRVGWSLGAEDLLKTFKFEFWEGLVDPPEREALRPKLGDEKAVVEPVCPDGRSVSVHLADSDDTAAGIVLAMEKQDRARNQIFNIAGYAPFRYGDVIQKVADGLGLPCAKVTVHGLQEYEISNEKAKKMLGYRPKYDIEALVDKALAGKGTAP